MLVCRDGTMAFKSLKGFGSRLSGLNKFKTRSEILARDTRNENKIDIPGYRTNAGQRTFIIRPFLCATLYPKGLL